MKKISLSIIVAIIFGACMQKSLQQKLSEAEKAVFEAKPVYNGGPMDSIIISDLHYEPCSMVEYYSFEYDEVTNKAAALAHKVAHPVQPSDSSKQLLDSVDYLDAEANFIDKLRASSDTTKALYKLDFFMSFRLNKSAHISGRGIGFLYQKDLSQAITNMDSIYHAQLSQ